MINSERNRVSDYEWKRVIDYERNRFFDYGRNRVIDYEKTGLLIMEGIELFKKGLILTGQTQQLNHSSTPVEERKH